MESLKNRLQSRGFQNPLKNQRGVIAFQFLIVLIIIFIFILSFFGLALSLVNGSAVQYLTYSSARALSLGGPTFEDQEQHAKTQYAQLRNKMFGGKWKSSGEWFSISTAPTLGMNYRYEDHSYRKMFYGAYASFISNRTNFKIPFLTDEDDGKLNTTIGSYLGREVSQKECQEFHQKRVDKICDLYSCSSSGPTLPDNNC